MRMRFSQFLIQLPRRQFYVVRPQRYFSLISPILASPRASFCPKMASQGAITVEKPATEVQLKELSPLPDFIAKREQLWQKYRERYQTELAAKIPQPIKVEVQDKEGNLQKIEVESWRASPLDVARKVGSKAWSEEFVISKVNGVLWDLERPLEEDSKVQLLKFEEHDAQQVYWHSTAHVLGEALERVYGGHLCYGPPIENGFYYDMYSCACCDKESANVSIDEGDKVDLSHQNKCPLGSISKGHFPVIEGVMNAVCKERQPFERLVLSKQELLDMFAYNKFKVRILNEKISEDYTTVYKCGTLIDLCRGPHVRNTGLIKSFKVTKSSSSLWEGKADAERLQRAYGISFPEQKQLKEWVRLQEEAAARDHRKVGKEQGLFFFHDLSPGSAFVSPRGAFIYNNLIDYLRQQYRKRGFKEVISPNVYNSKLWQTSGHWDHYADNMFRFEVEKEQFALKPMNCPGHCLIFDSQVRSWRDLPLRLADFGVLHRNELSGALSGLTRVRRFQQDDAHIFCMPHQIEKEIEECLAFLKDVYSTFNFTFDLVLSTRPDSYMGDIQVWNQAEKALENALNKFGIKWGLNPGDGAFYGPKIDVTVKDALKRSHQCATIQLDFQLPLRFKLKYASEDGDKTPVIIHRAIFGSVERFLAILTENFGGKWPFWLSPRQCIVLPIAEPFAEYAGEVKNEIYSAGFECETEVDPSLSFNKKVRNAQLDNFNFILVVGEREKENRTVNVRTRDNKVHGEISVVDLLDKFKRFKKAKTLQAEVDF